MLFNERKMTLLSPALRPNRSVVKRFESEKRARRALVLAESENERATADEKKIKEQETVLITEVLITLTKQALTRVSKKEGTCHQKKKKNTNMYICHYVH